MDFRRLKRLTYTASASVIAILVAACGGTTTAGTSPSPAVTVPSDLSISSFSQDFSYMPNLKGLVTAGHGMVGVILPDTTSSVRYVAYDQPYLTQAFTAAGYSPSDFKIDNAQGVEAQQLTIAQADISAGATVLIMDPLNSTVGSQIQTLAASKGVKVISYDRATFTGTNTYYVSFDNVQVGKLIGQGFLDCVTSWGVKNPQVFTLNGGENSDPNAVSFAMGYNSVVWGDSVPQETVGKTNTQGMKLVGDQVATNWTNSIGATIFQQAFTANKNINATIEANDGLAGAVIQVLKNKGVKPKTIPTTGQDATLDGMVSILDGYQCGSVYKAVYLEAQAAVALATVLRAGATPPTALVNGTTTPPSGVTGNPQPATLLVPVWVNAANMEATVIKDKFVDVTTLCSKAGAAVCTAAGIS
ncbi:MAG TPA: substrate-binding domain-containing protein [Candidatus Acidoferrum sp.]|jgi:D-xylose transport system substrate-binding protein|nr:substrate-binding domain-containing protein [Candidatus Acidoferrum sp.]